MHVAKYGKEIVPIPGDGHCFIKALVHAMNTDLGFKLEDKDVEKHVLNIMYGNIKHYVQYHATPNNEEEHEYTPESNYHSMMQAAEKFFTDKSEYRSDIVDVIIAAAADVLKVNLCIFQQIGTLAVIIQQKCSLEDTTNTVYLKYTRDPNGDRGSHYDAIVDCLIPVHPVDELEPNFPNPHVAEGEQEFDSTPLSTPSTTEESVESEVYEIPEMPP